MAVNDAARSGNMQAQKVTWVGTTLRAAEEISNNGPPRPGGQPVYILLVQGGGTFCLKNAREVKPGSPLRCGLVLEDVVSQANFDSLGHGVISENIYAPRLKEVGIPETDLLSGIEPDSVAEFDRKFHSIFG